MAYFQKVRTDQGWGVRANGDNHEIVWWTQKTYDEERSADDAIRFLFALCGGDSVPPIEFVDERTVTT